MYGRYKIIIPNFVITHEFPNQTPVPINHTYFSFQLTLDFSELNYDLHMLFINSHKRIIVHHSRNYIILPFHNLWGLMI